MKKFSKKEILYFLMLAAGALGVGLSFNVFSNYFKDTYNTTALQRGLIEFPRELPGVISIIIITLLASLGDIKLSILGKFLSVIGIAVLAFFTPQYNIMLTMIFIYSLGHHLCMPLTDSIGLSLTRDDNIGVKMGQFKGTQTAFTMIAAAIVFIGFRYGFFSFFTEIKMPFVFSAGFYIVAIVILFLLHLDLKTPIKKERKINWVFKKKYKYYYLLTIMKGVQKQIMFVYGPWVLIDILNKKADTISMIFFVSSFIGMFFLPFLGKMLDKYGIKKLMYADALSFIGVYLAYGFLTRGFVNETLSTIGIPLFLAYSIVIIDKMSMKMSFIKTVYLKSIAEEKSDITPTLTMGMSLDHVVSITVAIYSGVIWMNYGPQYIFFGVAALSLVNLYVAYKIIPQDLKLQNLS